MTMRYNNIVKELNHIRDNRGNIPLLLEQDKMNLVFAYNEGLIETVAVKETGNYASTHLVIVGEEDVFGFREIPTGNATRREFFKRKLKKSVTKGKYYDACYSNREYLKDFVGC